MGNLLFDLRFALRNLARRPGFAAVSVLTLALGIGAVTSIFAVARGVVLRPLPYPDPEELVVVWESNVERDLPKMFAAPPNFLDWARENRSLDGLAAFDPATFLLAGDDAEAGTLEVRGARVSASLFRTLGVAPRLGRAFTAAEDRPGGEPVAIVGHDLWHRRFGADPELPGRVVSVDGAPHRVVGVMPPGFSFPPAITLEGSAPAEKAELWTPLTLGPESGSRGAHYLTVIGRLADGVPLPAAEADLQRVAAAIAAEHPGSNEGWGVVVAPLRDDVLGEVAPALGLLLGAVGFVLLIACVNLSSLLLAQAEEREREIEVRRSLGASAGRVARQLVTESLATTALGGLAGLGLAVLLLDLLVALAPRNVPRLDEVAVDPTVVGVAFALALATGLAVSLVPVLRAVGRERRGAGSGRRAARGVSRYGDALVVAEVGLALVLLAGAGLFARSFFVLAGADAGFEAERVVTARLTLPPGSGDETADRTVRARAFERAEEAIATIPGVEAAGFVLELPLDADRQGTRVLVGAGVPADGAEPDFDGQPTVRTNFTFATPGYLPAMGVPLLAGRLPEAGDRLESEPVVVVNRTFARQLANLLGRSETADQPFEPSTVLGEAVLTGFQTQPRRIVGVVGDVLHDSLAREPFPNLYVPFGQLPTRRSLALAVRTELSPEETSRALLARLAEVEPRATLHGVRPMSGIVSASVAQPRFSSLLLAAFAVTALALAAVGVYGVLATSVRRRTRELGVRVAIGASRGRLIGAVAARWLSRVALGIALGLAAAAVLARSVESLLHGVEATDPATLLAAAALLAVVAAVACWIPTRRALAIDPKEALRAE